MENKNQLKVSIKVGNTCLYDIAATELCFSFRPIGADPDPSQCSY